MKQIILITVVSLLFLGGAFVFLMLNLERKSAGEEKIGLPTGILKVGDREIIVELAMDRSSQTRGLSYRESLDEDRGMLFVFDKPMTQRFWMYGMNFPIDIIFIKDDKVVQVAADVPHPEGVVPKIVSSSVKADKVLELNAGKAEEWGIRQGVIVKMVD
jgi:hypothetical protein